MTNDSGVGGPVRSSWFLTAGTVAWVATLIYSLHFFATAQLRITAIVASHAAAERGAVALYQRERVASLMRGALSSADSAIQLRRQPRSATVSAHEESSDTLLSAANLAMEARLRLATVTGAMYNLAGEDDRGIDPDGLMRAVKRIDLSVATEGLFEGSSTSVPGRPAVEGGWLSAESVDAASSKLAAWTVSAMADSGKRSPGDHQSPDRMLRSFMRGFLISGLGWACMLASFPTLLRFWRRSR